MARVGTTVEWLYDYLENIKLIILILHGNVKEHKMDMWAPLLFVFPTLFVYQKIYCFNHIKTKKIFVWGFFSPWIFHVCRSTNWAHKFAFLITIYIPV